MSKIICMLMVFIGLAFATGAGAQTTTAPNTIIKKSQLLVRPKDADGNIIAIPFFENPVLWARDKQQAFSGTMRTALNKLKTTGSTAAAWTLLSFGLAYGIFHAAGPGHGKVVISSWLIATENDLKRGLLVAFLSSMFQALTAIILVSGLYLIVASVGSVVRDVVGYLEQASYAMIAALGVYLIFTATRGWFRKPTLTIKTTSAPFNFEITNQHQHIGHVHDANCGHTHAPEPKDLRGDWSIKKALSLSFAIGLRPCTGAIAVLLAANTIGLYWAGVAATLAMGFGVFLTVSAIAMITVYGKDFAMKLASKDNQNIGTIINFLRLTGGVVVAFMGTIMFLGSLGTNNAIL
jgi:nickel/cobalt transporter (NicO) family protein